jgi:hypothetical protein
MAGEDPSEDLRKSVDFIQTGAKRQNVVVSGPGARARVLLGADYAALGQSDDALRELNLAVTLPANEASILYKAACLCCAPGRKQEAIGALSKAREAGFKDSSRARRDPDLAILRDDPEFDRLYPEKAAG